MKADTGKKRKRSAVCRTIEAEISESPLSAFLSLFSSGRQDGGAIIAGEIVTPLTGKKDAGDCR